MPTRLRLPIAVVAALVVAEAAVLLMRPRDRVQPVAVAPRAYFSAAQIEKGEAFEVRTDDRDLEVVAAARSILDSE